MSWVKDIPIKSVKFLLVGGFNTIAMYLLYWFLVRQGLHYNIALLIDYTVGIVTGYLMNRFWTFARHGNWHPHHGFLKYCLAYGLVYVVNCILLSMIVENRISGPEIGQIVALGGATVFSFLLQNFWVFKNGQDRHAPWRKDWFSKKDT